MKVSFIGKGIYKTASEQLEVEEKGSVDFAAAWNEEVKAGKAFREVLHTIFDYDDTFETLKSGTIYSMSSRKNIKEGVAGINMLFAKVAYKMCESHSEVNLDFTLNVNQEIKNLYLQQMDAVIFFGEREDEEIQEEIALLFESNPNVTIHFIDAKTYKTNKLEHAFS